MSTPSRQLMACACAITVVRLFSAFEIGIDQAIQLEAAERFVHGLGLTSTYFGTHPLDLSQATYAEYLTWFPPGFSVIVAAFLAIGVPLSASLRILYGTVTLAGWLGWALVFDKLVEQYVPRDRHVPLAISLVAILSPFLLTPAWSGTDLFLWAAVPFVVSVLFTLPQHRRPLLSAAIAGLVVGALCLVRYAAVFLVPASMLILAQVSLPDVLRFCKRAVVFGAAALVAIVPLLHRPASPAQGVVGFVESIDDVAQRPALADVAGHELPAIGMGLIGSPLLQKLGEKLQVAALAQAVGIFCVVVAVLLPLYAWRLGTVHRLPLGKNLPLSLAILQLCLNGFLFALSVTRPADSGSYLVIPRYFLPVSLASLFVWALLAGAREILRPGVMLARGIVCLFVVYYLIYIPVAAVARHDAVELWRVVLGSTPPRSHRYLSTSLPIPLVSSTIYSVKESSRRKVAELHRQYPDAVFFIQNYHYFVYGWEHRGDPVPGTHMRRFLPPLEKVRHGDPVKVPGGVMRSGLEFWHDAYAGKPMRVFWVLNSPEAIDFVPASSRQWISYDPFERTTIAMSDFPAGKLTQAAATSPPLAVRSSAH